CLRLVSAAASGLAYRRAELFGRGSSDMRLFAATFAAAALTAGAALAGPIDHFFDNTVVVHGAEGDALIHFNPDNSFHFTAPDGAMVHGAWEVRDQGLCMTWPDQTTNCWP